jgi:hypothetical protein
VRRNYVYQDGYCGRKIPYVIAVPITYLTVDRTVTYSILTESTTILENATIAVHTILAEWQAADATSIAGLTSPDDDDEALGGGADGGGDIEGGGLSADTKAGIGVGVALAVCLIGAIIFLIFRRRRSSSAKPGTLEMEDVYHGDGGIGGSARSSGVGGGSRAARGSGDGSARHHPRGGQRSSATSATLADSPVASPAPTYDARSPSSGHYSRTSVNIARSPADAGGLEATGGLGGHLETREVSPTTGRPVRRDAEIVVLREQKKAIQRRIEALQAGGEAEVR